MCPAASGPAAPPQTRPPTLLRAERAARGEAEANVDAAEHREGAVVEGAGHVARVEHDEGGGGL